MSPTGRIITVYDADDSCNIVDAILITDLGNSGFGGRANQSVIKRRRGPRSKSGLLAQVSSLSPFRSGITLQISVPSWEKYHGPAALGSAAHCRMPWHVRSRWTATAQAQPAAEDKKRDEAIQRTQRLLDERLVVCEEFQDAMPLDKFLQAVEKNSFPSLRRCRCGSTRKRWRRARRNGGDVDSVAAVSQDNKHSEGFGKSSIRRPKAKTDYRLGPWEAVITTPLGALTTVSYDIRDLDGQAERLATRRRRLFHGRRHCQRRPVSSGPFCSSRCRG